MSSKATSNNEHIKRQDSNTSQGSQFDDWDDGSEGEEKAKKLTLRTKMSFLRSRNSSPRDEIGGSPTSSTSKTTSPLLCKIRSHSPFRRRQSSTQDTNLPPIPRSNTHEMESSMQSSKGNDQESPLSVSDPNLQDTSVFTWSSSSETAFEKPRTPPAIPKRKGCETSTQSGGG